MLKVAFTGGGTAGHVLPNLVLIEAGLQRRWQISYLGSKTGIEAKLLQRKPVTYYPISVGKLRRYFSWRNFTDIFRMLMGIIQAGYHLHKIRPQLLFSKGGYVGLPVTIAARLLGIPVIVHESDLTAGLANRLAFYWADQIALAFAATRDRLPLRWQNKSVVTGIPLRSEFNQLTPRISPNRWLPHSNVERPFIVIFGGSLGSININRAVHAILPQLMIRYRVLHVCGQGSVIEGLQQKNYRQFEYIDEQFPLVLRSADLVISRAGANSIYELLQLAKPHILIPLGKEVSRGDQLLNAEFCRRKGYSMVVDEQKLLSNPQLLLATIDDWAKDPGFWQRALDSYQRTNAAQRLVELIENIADKRRITG